MNCIDIEIICTILGLPVKNERIEISRYFNFTGRQYPLICCQVEFAFNKYPITARGIDLNDVRPQISDICTERNLCSCRLNSEGNLQFLTEETGKVNYITIPCLRSTGNEYTLVAFVSAVNHFHGSTCAGRTCKCAIFKVIVKRIVILRRLNIVRRLFKFAALLSKNDTIKCRLLGKIATEKNRCIGRTPGSCICETPDRYALDIIAFSLSLKELREQILEIQTLLIILVRRRLNRVYIKLGYVDRNTEFVRILLKSADISLHGDRAGDMGLQTHTVKVTCLGDRLKNFDDLVLFPLSYSL